MEKAEHLQGAWKVRPSRLAGIALYAAAFMAALLLASKITLYCDDYFYGSVFRDGWDAFWEMTVWHYTEFNGRAFVHFIAEIVMSFGTTVFTPLFPVMLSCVFLLGGRLQSPKLSWDLLLVSGAAGLMAVLALPVQFLNSSLLWMSAAFNYLFPLCVIFPALWLEIREEKGKGRFALTLALSFLAGATTEQSGLAAAVCLGGWGILAWLRKQRTFWQGILPGFCAGVGYLTVVFAPGTWVRIGNETGGGLMHLFAPGVMPHRFQLAMNYTSGREGLPALIVAFALLTALHALLRHGPQPLLSGFVVAPLYALLHHFQFSWQGNVLAVLYLFMAAGIYLWKPESTVRGLFILGMLASQLVMMFSGTVGNRTAIPGILLLIAVCASLLGECLEQFPFWAGGVSCAMLAAVFFVLFLPTYRGYASNAEVYAYNEAQLRREDTGIVHLSLDLEGDYRYIMFCDSLVYLENAITYYRVEDKRISFIASEGYAGLSDGVQSGLPVLVENGEPIFPILNTVRLCGGEAGWSGVLGGTTAEMDGKAYVFLNPTDQAQAYDPETEEYVGDPVPADVRVPFYTHYVDGASLRELFGITWTYDEEDNIYYVRPGDRAADS